MRKNRGGAISYMGRISSDTTWGLHVRRIVLVVRVWMSARKRRAKGRLERGKVGRREIYL